MTVERVEIHDEGAIAILQSAEVVAKLQQMAQLISEEASSRELGPTERHREHRHNGTFEVLTGRTKTRANVKVVTADLEAKLNEAHNRALLGSMEAGGR